MQILFFLDSGTKQKLMRDEMENLLNRAGPHGLIEALSLH